MARQLTQSSSQYLEYGSAIVSAPPFSFACWFYRDSVNYQELFGLGSTAINNWHGLLLYGTTGTGLRAYSRGAGSTHAEASPASPTAGAIHHACGVWAATNDRRVYLDGGNKATDAGNQSPTVDVTSIGRLVVNGSGYYYADGWIAEAALWNVALTDDDVASLAKGFSPLLICCGSLVAYWPLGGLNGRHDRDHFGQYSLTAYNVPTWADHPPVIYPCGPHVAAPSTTRVPWHLFGGAAA